jgi:hypothetical protein
LLQEAPCRQSLVVEMETQETNLLDPTGLFSSNNNNNLLKRRKRRIMEPREAHIPNR